MNEIELLREYCRMCKHYTLCIDGCEIYNPEYSDFECKEWAFENYEKACDFITKWAEKHTQKTRQDIFLERYPKARLVNGGLPICPNLIDDVTSCCNEQTCSECQKRYWITLAEETDETDKI